jgi:hypothetical protein
MSYQFGKHYTLEEARELLPQVRQWLGQLLELRTRLGEHEQRLSGLPANGADVGGPLVNSWVRSLVDLQSVLLEFYRREIQIKDIDRGLVDFPSLLADKEVFLCWEQGEDDIEFWHELDAGYAGRERL